MSSSKHIWHFKTIGGSNRVNLHCGEDLKNLINLDPKLWTVLSLPVEQLELCPDTLRLIDSDNDGKIRISDILNSLNWLLERINQPEELISRPQQFPLSAINQEHKDGKDLLGAAHVILKNLNKSDSNEITLSEIALIKDLFAQTAFNGDGVITTLSTSDLELQELITIIINLIGTSTDLSGLAGISQEQILKFTQLAEEYNTLNTFNIDKTTEIFPLGDETKELYHIFLALKEKFTDFFLRCKLQNFNPNGDSQQAIIEEKLSNICKLESLSPSQEEIAALPLCEISITNQISVGNRLNPVWRDKVILFVEYAEKLLNKKIDNLCESDIEEVEILLQPYQKHSTELTNNVLSTLDHNYINNYLTTNQKDKLLKLIEEDLAVKQEVEFIFEVDKLVKLYCNIFTLLNNFVTFSDFYDYNRKAIFQAGKLYFNQRSCDLCIRVNNLVKHNQIVNSSGICLGYFDCTSKSLNKNFTIVAAFTDGDIGNLEVGRNGLFYDNQGNDYDATVIKVVENPISIRQAFWSPYRKIYSTIAKQIEKVASSQENKVTNSATSNIEKVSNKTEKSLDNSTKKDDLEHISKPENSPENKASTFDIAKYAGIFAAIGLAFAAISSAATMILKSFFALSWWQMPLVILGLLLSISLPSMFIASFKLRKRNLAPLLDANGWAINASASININFGASLTSIAKLPANSRIDLFDPFKAKKVRWPWYLIFITILIVATLWYLGLIPNWFNYKF